MAETSVEQPKDVTIEQSLKDNGVERTVKFEKNIRSFFSICRFINKAYQDKSLVVTQNFIFESFESFVNIYDKISDPLKTLPVFEEVYNSRKIKILSKSEDWINDKFIIEYPRVKKAKKKISIFVSIFYSKAKELAETAHKEIYEFNNDKNADNLHLVQKLQLPLLRIFLLCCKEDETAMLEEYISELESELPSTSGTTPGEQPPPFNPASLFSGLGGMDIGSMINSVMGNMNQSQRGRGRGSKGKGRGRGGQKPSKMEPKEKPKEDSKQEAEEEPEDIDEEMDKLQNMVGDVLSNPNVKNVAGTVIRKFKNADTSSMEGIGSIISDLFADQELRESLVNMMPQPITEEEAEEMIEEASGESNKNDEDSEQDEDEQGEEEEEQ